MTFSALLLAAAVLAPGQQTATVPTGILPPVSVGTTNPECGVIVFTTTSATPVDVDGGGELGNQPPWRTTVTGQQPAATIRIHRTPGTSLTWEVRYFGGGVAAHGELVVPPCLAPALEPRPQIVVDDTIEIGTPVRMERRRGDMWSWVLRRWGMS